MAPTQDDTTSQALLDQQRVLAAFGEVALETEDLSALLTEACRLVGQALEPISPRCGVACPRAKPCWCALASAGNQVWSIEAVISAGGELSGRPDA